VGGGIESSKEKIHVITRGFSHFTVERSSAESSIDGTGVREPPPRVTSNLQKAITAEVRMKWLRLFSVITVAVMMSFLVSTAHAQAPVHIVQTDCDTLSLDPPLVKVTFGVINLGPIPVCSVHLVPIQSGSTPPDSCRILDCTSPPGWQCAAHTPDGGAVWTVDPAQPGPGCIQQGQKFEPYTITLDPLFCCYQALFDDGAGNIFFSDVICFECQKPLPTKTTTWGNLKSIYH
jgi:hypothetical protein